jgi:hypothetical protein
MTDAAPIVIPGLRAMSRRAMPIIIEAMIIPATILMVGTRLFGIWVALGVALAWAYVGVGRRVLRGRRVSGTLLLAAITLSARTAAAGFTGNTDLYFIQPALGDATLGLAFLVSLLTGGSLIERLAGDIVPVEDMIDRPCVRIMFSRITLLWGAVLLLHAGLGVWMLLSQDVGTYVVTRPIVAFGLKTLAIIASTVWFKMAIRRRGVALVIA